MDISYDQVNHEQTVVVAHPPFLYKIDKDLDQLKMRQLS
jgi:hypothetical protein